MIFYSSYIGAEMLQSYMWMDGLGWDWVGWDLCVGLLYEHRFAVLIILHQYFGGTQHCTRAAVVAAPGHHQILHGAPVKLKLLTKGGQDRRGQCKLCCLCEGEREMIDWCQDDIYKLSQGKIPVQARKISYMTLAPNTAVMPNLWQSATSCCPKVVVGVTTIVKVEYWHVMEFVPGRKGDHHMVLVMCIQCRLQNVHLRMLCHCDWKFENITWKSRSMGKEGNCLLKYLKCALIAYSSIILVSEDILAF